MLSGKQITAIKALPKNPIKHIFWIVYNTDMIKTTEDTIRSVWGSGYLKEHVSVVAKSDPSKDRSNGIVYFDPLLMDLLGNGNT